ncbi:LOW QUALITY PROTEIN: G-protein coupled receptor moody-like [Amphiura filiformis]|uniref:LOW QUALITY PROTEIN: G-protein coupled receptor moody-like n=1 Tax=Amphiura filiformis TaxID=82378 RepID=UPI003B20C24B
MVSTEGTMSSSVFTIDIPMDNHTDHFHSVYSYEERIFFATTLIVISITGIIGNSATIAAVVLSKKLRDETNVFVVCLAVSDLITCLAISLSIFTLLNKAGWPWPEHEWLCSASATLAYGGTGSSEICLAAIAINRLILIKWPLTIYHKVFRKGPMIAMVIFILLGPSIILVAFPLFGIGGLGYDEKHNVCADVDYHPHARTYELIQHAILYPISFVTIVICYLLIFCHIRRRFGRQRQTELTRLDSLDCLAGCEASVTLNVVKHSSNNSGIPPPTPTSPRLEHIDKIQYEITKISSRHSVYSFCVTPYALILLTPRTFHQGRALLYCALPVVFAACVNPIIYALRHPQFRAVFGPMARCRYRDIPEPSGSLRRLVYDDQV